jgi:hypothetical protein
MNTTAASTRPATKVREHLRLSLIFKLLRFSRNILAVIPTILFTATVQPGFAAMVSRLIHICRLEIFCKGIIRPDLVAGHGGDHLE